MQRKSLRLLAGLACVSLFIWGCNKLDSTTLGDDLIPAVDNVSTFADTLFIAASRESNVDTTKMSRTDDHALGSINNDPVFGKTRADIFLQLKPTSFPFYFTAATDTLVKFDSVVLCLSFKSFYGDSLKAQHFKVYRLNENTTNFLDTVAHPLSFQPIPYPTELLGEADVYEPALKTYQYLKTTLKDSVVNQIRIPITNAAFIHELVTGDSSENQFFHNDSLFKKKFPGFGVVADGGTDANGLFYVNLADPATRLEIYHVKSHGVSDTAFTSFPLSVGATVSASATANYLKRDTAGAEFAIAPDPNALYILSAPGTAIGLKVPQLDTFANRIIHRAEIIMEQVPGSPYDDVLTSPTYLYLDLSDDTTTSGVKKYKPLYYDLNPNDFYSPDALTAFFPASGIDYAYFGGYRRTATGGTGTRDYYSFNVTRYVQNIVTRRGASSINYKMRVYAPYNLTYNSLNFRYQNRLAAGRVKIYNGPDATHRVRMRVVWSKL